MLAKLPDLPDTMRESGRRANQYENAVLNLVEAAVLAPRLGESFPAVILEVDERDDRRGDVTIQDPAIEAVVGLRPAARGQDVTVTLTTADVTTRKVEFTLE